MKIRNFLYLDSAKLRSLSSQLFEGVTDFILQNEQTQSISAEEQKGPVASGKRLAEIYQQSQNSSQMRFLEDHAYAIFEDRLIDEKIIRDLTSKDKIHPIQNQTLILVEGTLSLNDMDAIEKIVENFNEYGTSLYRVINNQEISEKKLGDAEIKSRATQEGFLQDKKFQDALRKVVNFGYQGMLEAQINFRNRSFSAPLKREFLRETEGYIIHKFSRKSQAKFRMLGMVTQVGGVMSMTPPDVKDQPDIKTALRTLLEHMAEVEGTFSRPTENEIIIDPVALYTEITSSDLK